MNNIFSVLMGDGNFDRLYIWNCLSVFVFGEIDLLTVC